jgi:hypothetical protein
VRDGRVVVEDEHAPTGMIEGAGGRPDAEEKETAAPPREPAPGEDIDGSA